MRQSLHSMVVRLGLGSVLGHLWVFSWQSIDLVWVIFAVGLTVFQDGELGAGRDLSFVISGLRG
jgi:hypothetical protein